jgi:hypothetical protein
MQIHSRRASASPKTQNILPQPTADRLLKYPVAAKLSQSVGARL